MAQSRWTMIMARMVPMGLIMLITVSLIFVTTLFSVTSIQINKNDFHKFGRIFLKDSEKIIDSIAPLGEPSLHIEKNLSQSIIQNSGQFIIQNFSDSILQNITQIVWPIKATIKYGISKGLIMIVNASSENDMKSIFVAASQHRATSSQWDINGALDGYVGELFAEVLDEVHNIEEARDVIVETMKECNCNKMFGTNISIILSFDTSKINLIKHIIFLYLFHILTNFINDY